jgi:paraquat-inducible protein B
LITTAKVDTAHNYDVISAKFKSVEAAITIRSVNQDFQVNIMEPIQPQQRRVADQVFQQSLDQLEDILQEISTEEEEIPHLPQLHTTNLNEVEVDQDLIAIDLAALEDAVADIEQYLEEKTKTQEKL